MTTSDAGVVMVGAGVAGLCCAGTLVRSGRTVPVLEAADEVAGRIGTDALDGYRLDRGFEVLQTAYPEARSALDLSSAWGWWRSATSLRLICVLPGWGCMAGVPEACDK